ncbi:MAG TPA: zf-HC2 domain-containing protein [Bacillota bacterium]|nr:zf-HC2 domain-containing protein [Bacillota bacterium]
MKECAIVEDLLPLYNEDLVQEDTRKWIKEHVKTCENCAKLEEMSEEKLEVEEIDSPVNYEKMMRKNTFKISFYQLLFVGISFFLAIRSVILFDRFNFILYYTLLGFVTYLFYRRYAIVTLISFLPVFLWFSGMFFANWHEVSRTSFSSTGELIGEFLYGAFIGGALHLLFALIGATIGLFTLKLFESEDEK